MNDVLKVRIGPLEIEIWCRDSESASALGHELVEVVIPALTAEARKPDSRIVKATMQEGDKAYALVPKRPAP